MKYKYQITKTTDNLKKEKTEIVHETNWLFSAIWNSLKYGIKFKKVKK